MKTIIIPIFHGHIARNILRTGVLPELKKEARVILAVPELKKEFYDREFSDGRVTVVVVPKPEFSRMNLFFRSFYYYFVDTDTVRIIHGEQFLLKNKLMRYAWARFWTKIFGHSRLLRRFVRHLDRICVKDAAFSDIFDKYAPDIAFIPSITSDDEGLILRQAKARGIRTVGMVRSWDNITVNKGNIRIYPDKLLVHTAIMKDETARYTDMDPERIEVVGMPHFDYYRNDPRIPREKFFKQIGGDAGKRTIYFMPIGLSDIEEDKYMLGLIENWVSHDPAFSNTQLMLSIHPNSTKPMDYASDKMLFIKPLNVLEYLGDKATDREITKQAMELMASAIYHADVVVNYQGTTSIDAAAFDKPVVNIAFDGAKNKPYLKSVRRFYDFTHYLPIITAGGMRIAHTPEELRSEILAYLVDPSRDAAGRAHIIREQAPMHDGRASYRTAQAILRTI